MKRVILLVALLSIFCLSRIFAYDVSITATAGHSGSSLLDQNGSPLAQGKLGLLVVDSASDGIDPIQPGSFTTGAFYNGTDDYIAGFVASTVAFGTSTVQFSALDVNNSSLSANMPFYIEWFPTLSSNATSFTAGAPYGDTRLSTWVLPSDGGNTSGLAAADGSTANLSVVPEPSTFALLGAGVCVIACVILRKRVIS